MSDDLRLPPRHMADIQRAIRRITEETFPLPREEQAMPIFRMETKLIWYVERVMEATLQQCWKEFDEASKEN